MSESVVLSFPRDSRYYAVARMVVGGMAAPLEMSYDALDDLQLAISSLLDHDAIKLHGDNDTVNLRIEVSNEKLVAAIGGFGEGSVTSALAQSNGSGGSEQFGLRRLLDTIVDEVEVVSMDGSGEWVTLAKSVGGAA